MARLPAFDDVACESVCTHEVKHFLTVGLEDGVLVSLPKERSLVDESDLVSDFKDGVHVVGVYDRCHVELLGKVIYETVNKD